MSLKVTIHFLYVTKLYSVRVCVHKGTVKSLFTLVIVCKTDLLLYVCLCNVSEREKRDAQLVDMHSWYKRRNELC